MNETSALTLAFASIVVTVVAAFLLGRRFTKNSPPIVPEKPDGLARLLVAEIALHHRKSLDEARSQMAIYRLLKSDIDRSRQMFLARHPDAEAAWYAALVGILAQGHPERLGTDYPYQRA